MIFQHNNSCNWQYNDYFFFLSLTIINEKKERKKEIIPFHFTHNFYIYLYNIHNVHIIFM